MTQANSKPDAKVLDLAAFRNARAAEASPPEHDYESFSEPGREGAPQPPSPINGTAMDERNMQAIDDISAVAIVGDQMFITLTFKERDAKGKPLIRPTEDWYRSLKCVLRGTDQPWQLNLDITSVYEEDWMPGKPVTLTTAAYFGPEPLAQMCRDDDQLVIVSPSGHFRETVRTIGELCRAPT